MSMHFAEERNTTIPLNARVDLMDKSEMAELIHSIDFVKVNRKLHEQLYQLHIRGPVWDGDVISKSDRDELLSVGACAKVCVKGEQGFNGCTYFGRHLLHIFDWLYGPMNDDPIK
ncbi:MAG: hypothetical protein AAGD43_16340 [Pseudomonadota bacterium]